MRQGARLRAETLLLSGGAQTRTLGLQRGSDILRVQYENKNNRLGQGVDQKGEKRAPDRQALTAGGGP